MKHFIHWDSIVKRFSFMVVCISIVCLVFTGCPLAFNDDGGGDDTGDNDDFIHATIIPKATKNWTGAISSDEDIDIFKVWFDGGAWYIIKLIGLTADLNIELWDIDEEYRNSGELEGVVDETINQSIIQDDEGYFYLVVYGVDGEQSNYTIDISNP